MDASRARRFTTIAVATAVAAVASGCAGRPPDSVPAAATPAASTASPRRSPTLEPTPDAGAVVLEYLRRDRQPSFWSITASETVPSAIFIEGVELSPAPPDLVVGYSGELLITDEGHLARLKADGDNPWVVESIHRGTRSERRLGADGWGSVTAFDRLPDLLRSVDHLESAGSIERGGRKLDRFRVTSRIPLQLATVWHVEEPMGEPDEGTLEVLADESGVPQAFSARIVSDDLSTQFGDMPTPKPRSYTFDFDREAVPADASLPDVLARYDVLDVPEHDLAVGVPSGWQRETVEDGMVWFQAADKSAFLGIARVEVPEARPDDMRQLDGWTKAVMRRTSESTGTKPVAVELARAGDSPCYIATYHVPGSSGQEPFVRMDATFLGRGWSYLARWESGGDYDLVAHYTLGRMLEALVLY
jgi:hypothetical protein